MRDALAGRLCRSACSLPTTADIEDLAPDLPRLALVALQFPKWVDGRAYSQARLLRCALPLRRRSARHRRGAGRHAAAAAAHRLRRRGAAPRPERSTPPSARWASSPATTRATCASTGRCSREPPGTAERTGPAAELPRVRQRRRVDMSAIDALRPRHGRLRRAAWRTRVAVLQIGRRRACRAHRAGHQPGRRGHGLTDLIARHALPIAIGHARDRQAARRDAGADRPHRGSATACRSRSTSRPPRRWSTSSQTHGERRDVPTASSCARPAAASASSSRCRACWPAAAPGSPACAASRADARGGGAVQRPRRRRAASSSTRWPTGAGPTCGTTSQRNDVPYNPLHDQFMPSIGCAPCTRAIAVGEAFRAGRWWWEDEKRQGMRPARQGRRAPPFHDRSPAHERPRRPSSNCCPNSTTRHLDWLEEEAIFILREVAGAFERPALLFSGGKDSCVVLRLAEKAFKTQRGTGRRVPGPAALPAAARGHRPQLPRGDRVPRPPRGRDGRAPGRRPPGGFDPARHGAPGAPAGVAQRPPDGDAARGHRGAPLRRA